MILPSGSSTYAVATAPPRRSARDRMRGRSGVPARSIGRRRIPRTTTTSSAGEGGATTADTGGGGAGDLYLDVEFRPHVLYRVDKHDVYMDLPIAPWEAALGAIVPVKMPDGSTLKVRIPAGTQSGNTLTVAGKGLPSQPPGDLDLSVQVVLPPADTPQARELYKTMAKELAFNPRSTQAASQPGQSR